MRARRLIDGRDDRLFRPIPSDPEGSEGIGLPLTATVIHRRHPSSASSFLRCDAIRSGAAEPTATCAVNIGPARADEEAQALRLRRPAVPHLHRDWDRLPLARSSSVPRHLSPALPPPWAAHTRFAFVTSSSGAASGGIACARWSVRGIGSCIAAHAHPVLCSPEATPELTQAVSAATIPCTLKRRQQSQPECSLVSIGVRLWFVVVASAYGMCARSARVRGRPTLCLRLFGCV
jgi:hypothetical protein